jgi:flagellar basal-body rod modification protein FlgD
MNTIDSLAATGTSSSAAASGAGDTVSADRFLKLLVTQLQNQDPLNPMDNAQITTQMAQINTVTGIENLNTSILNLQAQFIQMQALQGAGLVGHDVTVEGNRLTLGEDGVAQAGFSLAGSADSVKVDILDGAGHVVETLDLGALEGGRHGFDWDAGDLDSLDGYSFRVTAQLGAAAVTATPLMLDRVRSVGLDAGEGLVLDLERSGQVPYGDVHALN